MGTLSERGDAPVTLTGDGKRLVEWWLQADDDDRATLRGWVDARVSHADIADRLTADGCTISRGTVCNGLRLLRRAHWAP